MKSNSIFSGWPDSDSVQLFCSVYGFKVEAVSAYLNNITDPSYRIDPLDKLNFRLVWDMDLKRKIAA